jgi:hypothetical protein
MGATREAKPVRRCGCRRWFNLRDEVAYAACALTRGSSGLGAMAARVPRVLPLWHLRRRAGRVCEIRFRQRIVRELALKAIREII